MSIIYSIDIHLNATFDEHNIQSILQAGLNNHLTYRDSTILSDYRDYPVLSIDDCIKKIFNYYAQPHSLEQELGIHTTIKNNFGILWFFKDDYSKIIFSLGGFGIPERKDFFSNKRGIDWQFYIELSLALCSEFEITKLKTVDESNE